MKRWALIAAGFLLLAAVFGTFFRLKPLSAGDPDRYYHTALSKLTYESGRPFLRSVPQVEDLGWGDYFLDKEFLFHEVTTLGYAIGGETGVDMSSFLCAMAAVLAFYLFAAGRLPVAAAWAVTAFALSNPYFMFRLSLLRPHTLAILTFILMNIALLTRRPRLTAAAAFLFVLSYHAFYVSLICFALIFVLSYLDDREAGPSWRKTALLGAFGCLAGLLANPYFPGNIVLAAIHMRIPELMKGELRGAPFGDELVPLRADAHFNVFFASILILLATTFFLGLDLRQRDEPAKSYRVRLLYLLGVAGFFLAVSFQIARAGEYLVPLGGFALVLVAERWKDRWQWATLVFTVGALVQWAQAIHVYRGERAEGTNDRVRETFKSIDAIPAEPKGAKVFNCEWDRTPYLFYKRPDLRFIDIMDPSLLYFANPTAYRVREELRAGTTPDAYGLIRKAFKSDYVLCGDPNISAQLRAEPGFQQIYPKSQNPGQPAIVLSVFRVLPESAKEYATKLLLAQPEKLDEVSLGKLAPPAPGEKRKEVELEKSSYLNLSHVLPPKHDAGPVLCAFASPSPADLHRLAGATYLGVGGGPGVKVWQNGKPLFSTRAGFPDAKNVQVLIPLLSPLRDSDRIDVLSCSSVGGAFWGVSISLWTEASLRAECDRKNEAMNAPTTEGTQFPLQGIQALTCLGPIASPYVGAKFHVTKAATSR